MGRRGGIYSWTTIGPDMEEAITAITRNSQRAVTALTSYDLLIDQTIPMLFPDDVIAKATAAKGIVKPSFNNPSYTIGLSIGGGEIAIGLNFEKSKSLPIEPNYLAPNSSRYAPLATYCLAVEEIYLKYENVKAVLRWLNAHATAGAIRHYFPTAMQLVPHASCWGEGSARSVAPTRYAEPANVHDWLQAIRNAAQTAASALLLPEHVTPKARDAMWLTFKARRVMVGEQSYMTDQ